jgi:acetyltransferase-like isoleucine patch superfamily enzyme
VRKDHRPHVVHKLNKAWAKFYAKHYLHPQFDAIGAGIRFIDPFHVEVNGSNIRLGNHVHMMSKKEHPISFTAYTGPHGSGEIALGNYCIVLPGATIVSACSITAGDNCMFAAGCYLTDADWHGIYNRTSVPGNMAPIRLGNNVWVGYKAIVCKGVTVGDNSIIGTGAVVSKDVPENVVVAGNPAKVVKKLDPEEGFTSRESLFFGDDPFWEYSRRLERFAYHSNTFRDWIRTLIRPTKAD